MSNALKILIIEDSENDTILLLRNLRKGGYDVTSKRVQTLEDMSLALENETWDVILSDYSMPRFSGLAALEVCKQKGLDIPFIIISGAIGEVTAVEAMKAGAHDYLMKDNLARLVPAIARELREAETRQQRRKAEFALRESEATSHALLNASTEISILIEPDGTIIAVNDATCQAFSKPREELVGTSIYNYTSPEFNEVNEKYIAQVISSGIPVDYQSQYDDRFLDIRIYPAYDLQGKVAQLAIYAFDVTERKQAQQALKESEERFRNLIQHSTDIIIILDEVGKITFISPSVENILGSPPQYYINRIGFEIIHPEDLEYIQRKFNWSLQNPNAIVQSEFRVLAKDGRWVTIDTITTNQLNNPSVRGLIINARDLTERKRSEDELRASEDRFRSLVQFSYDIITLHQTDGTLFYESPSTTRILGYAPNSLIGKNYIEDLIHPQDLPSVRTAFQEINSSPDKTTAIEYRIRRADGNWIYLESIGCNLIGNPGVGGILLTSREVTDRKSTEEELRRLNRALRTISECNQALIRANDEEALLKDICQIIVEIGKHYFVWIGYIQTDSMQTLRPMSFHGHEEGYLQTIDIKIKDGSNYNPLAESIRTIKPVIVSDISTLPESVLWRNKALERGYASVIALPLTYGGEIFGNLGIYNDKPNIFTDDEVHLMSELADDLSYGIHMLRVKAERNLAGKLLEKTNRDLEVAYDATLEGWSRALELRERETAGHSQRVVSLTLSLAKMMGIKDEDLIHIRRGALLHDIGKMGIPDNILLKPGPLTDEEWVIMRQHPLYAFQLLSNIPYLLPAMDIPFSHHERWDGSGYPRGLRGEHIPLGARIFAVVDVFDALMSNRPYRPAWPVEATINHLKDNAGKQFDPAVIETFMQLDISISPNAY
jgi:PAS domain S-box-containing protein